MKKNVKEEILSFISKKKYKKIIPFLMNDFQEIFSNEEMKSLIIDEDSGFFKATITIFGEHLDESYDYDDDTYIEDLSFLSICNEIETQRLQTLCLSVMTDSMIKNYFPIIEQGFLLRFTLDELLEILECFDINRLEVFIQSVSEAVQRLMEFDEFQKGETFNFLIELGKNFTELLITNMLQVIIRSKPIRIKYNENLVRTNWDLPLSVDILGWYNDLNLEQLQNLMTHLRLNYRDKTIDSWVRMQLRLLIRKLKSHLKEFYDFPIENLSLTKARIREFLYRLAGEEGCQFSALKWRCGGSEFTYAKKILNLMDIPLKEQDILFEACKKYGGHCDCEILMNAASWLLNEDTPW